MAQETLHFQAEVKQLLQLMIHSLYSHKEIFMREFISNASDAADKLRYEAIADASLYENDADLRIRIAYDAQARTISIDDNGIGMTREEAISHLGTIARSGTKEFFAKLSGDSQKDAALIGQFGVGFYSGFIVADRITVESRKAGVPAAQGVRWESSGEGDFNVETIARPARGTTVTLHLREGEDEWLSSWKLESTIRKYADHIAIPILMRKEEWDAEKQAHVQKEEEETVNQASALWTRAKNEIDEAQYKSFYHHLSHDGQDPLCWTHNRVEGRNEYTQLLYVPENPPFDLWDRNQSRGLKLYVQRVFIMDDATQLLPSYLRFIRGVVDSNDLPLNVSREILQESRDVKAIREGVTKRSLSMLEDLAKNKEEQYRTFWNAFGQVLKEGIGEDMANRDRIAKLIRINSTHSDVPGQTTSLAEYVARMKPEQTKIYYVTAESEQAARNSPHLEVLTQKGVEVLLFSDRVDEWMLSFLQEFEGKPLTSVARGDLDLATLSDEEKKAQEAQQETFKPVLEAMKEVLKERVKEVRLSARLANSPSCLVADDEQMSGYLQRLLKASGQAAPEFKPILELNPTHALVARLQSEQADFAQWAHLLFDQALLAEGGTLENPADYVQRTNALLMASL